MFRRRLALEIINDICSAFVIFFRFDVLMEDSRAVKPFKTDFVSRFSVLVEY